MATELNKTEIREIVTDEISRFISKELENELHKLMKNGKPRDEVVNIIQAALTSLYKYMFIRSSVWKADIK